MTYLKGHAPGSTPQSAPLRADQVPNSAGGFAWQIDCWEQLRRFLILGSEGGSYYASEHDLTRESIAGVEAAITADGTRAVEMIVDVSHRGLAPRNDPAIYALALAASVDDLATRTAALDALPKVCRIGTHLFKFNAFVEERRGRGRALNRAVRDWYLSKPVDKLAYELIKYRQREGWSHRDMLRLAKPRPSNRLQSGLFAFAVGKDPGLSDGDVPLLDAYLAVHSGIPVKQIAEITGYYGLPREALPSQALNDAGVWDAMLPKMPLTAMVRNLATMTRVGLVKPGSEAVATIVERLGNREQLQRARVHPVAILIAQLTYAAGHGLRGRHTWSPVAQIIDALDDAFHAAFVNVEPTGKRITLAIDISPSMGGGSIAGIPGFTPRMGAAAMALVTAAVEPRYDCVAFAGAGGYGGRGIEPFPISGKQRLADVIRSASAISSRFTSTDCALPMIDAHARKDMEIDAFVIYTDNETWSGGVHPAQALVDYRRASGRPSKLAVVGMVSNRISIADPLDAGMLDFVGFDASTPAVLSDFIGH